MPFCFDTSLGRLGVSASAQAITRVWLNGEATDEEAGSEPSVLQQEAARQLRAYCEGRLRVFDLPLSPEGTAFMQSVWETLRGVPFGETVTYGWLAAAAGYPGAARAVGQAMHRNPIPIIIPCHRVVGAKGLLTGFGGGMDLKRRLLAIEGIPTDGLYVLPKAEKFI